MKHKKHNKIVKNYDKQKSKHLEKLASKTLKLKGKPLKGDFLDNF